MQRIHTTGRPHGLLCSLVLLLVLGVGLAFGQAGDTPRKGGTLRVAILEPSTLDPLWTARDDYTVTLAQHYLEGLYTLGQDYGPTPLLAAGHTVSDNGLVYTVTLRRGVLFHNGQELTAADAVASLLRWGKLNSFGKTFFTQYVEVVTPLDRYTLQLRLHEKTAVVLPLLQVAIYPKKVLDEAGNGEVQTLIGTGPFKVAEHQPGRFLKLVRFEQYQARPEPPNGRGGGKTAWVDTLHFVFLPDGSARLAAVEAGEVDFAYSIPHKFHDRAQAHPDLKVQRMEYPFEPTTMLNKKQGVFTNVKLRQAFLAALNMDAILRAAYEHPALYHLDASLEPRVSLWWTDVGQERYNQQDQAKARQLLQEAGYQGQPIRYWTVPEAAPWQRALATKQQLEEVGFTVELQVMEWATLYQRKDAPDLWDASTVSFDFVLDPTLRSNLRCVSDGGWNCDPDFVRLVHALETDLRFEKRYRLWQDIQQLFWERVPYIHYGHVFRLLAMRKHVYGPFDMPYLYFWNVWVEK